MYFLGIDFGTSGARSCVIDAEGAIVAEDVRDFGVLDDYERAGIWREALWDLVASLPPPIRTQLSDRRLDDALARYTDLERRLDQMEARAESFDLGGSRDLSQEFATLEAEGRVDQELAELKARLGRS